MLLPGRIYSERGLWHFEDFCNIFLLNVGEDQKKKSHHLSAGLVVSGVAATWWFLFCDRLQGAAKGGFAVNSASKKKKSKTRKGFTKRQLAHIKKLKFELLFVRCCIQAAFKLYNVTRGRFRSRV